MATATTQIVLTVTDATQAGANAKAKAAAVDAIKQNLSALNLALSTRVPPEAQVTTAAVDAANVATLTRWLTIIIRGFVISSARAWRVHVADASTIEPIRTSPGDFDHPA